MAAVLALGVGGAERSLLVLAPLVAFGLPVMAMIAFWWEDWPGPSLRARRSGLADTGLVVAAALVLTVSAQAVTGTTDVPALVDPFPSPPVEPTFPTLMPVAGVAFGVLLQLALVCEGWPLRRLPRLTRGVVAVVVSWLAALVLSGLLLGVQFFAGSDRQEAAAVVSDGMFGAVPTVLVAWQVTVFVLWRGWPVAGIARRGTRVTAGNALVLGGAALTVVVLAGPFQMVAPRIAATATCFVAAGVVVGMLFRSNWDGSGSLLRRRGAALALAVVGTALLDLFLASYAVGVDWRRGTDEDWVRYAGDAIVASVLLHVAIGRRWPIARRTEPSRELR